MVRIGCGGAGFGVNVGIARVRRASTRSGTVAARGSGGRMGQRGGTAGGKRLRKLDEQENEANQSQIDDNPYSRADILSVAKLIGLLVQLRRDVTQSLGKGRLSRVALG